MTTATGHRRTVAEEPVTSILKAGDIPVNDNGEWDSDEEVLAALGYKPEFKREFSLFTTFCVSFAVLGLLPSFASTLFYGMGYAGTAGMNKQRYDKQQLTFSRNDVGMDHSYDRHPVRSNEYG